MILNERISRIKMNLRHVKISELTFLVSSTEYSDWKNLPISPARAYSQSLNPNSQPDDVALVIALDDDNNEVLGFIGAFPSTTQRSEAKRVVWVSNWWVSEQARGQGLALILLKSLLEVWGNKVALPDLTDKTLKIINNTGLFYSMKRDGVLLYIRPGIVTRLKVLSFSRYKIKKIAKPVLYAGLPWLTDKIINLFLFLPNLFQSGFSKTPNPMKLSFPEEKDFEFMRKEGEFDFHLPGKDELEMPSWLIKHTPHNHVLAEKYYFSLFAFDFSTFWLRWEENGRINALVMLSLRDGVLKTPYIFCEKQFRHIFPSEFLYYCFKNQSVNTLMTAHPLLTNYIAKSRYFILMRRNFTRYSAVSNDLMKYFDSELMFQDGDGDSRFT